MADSFRCVVAIPTRELFSGDVYYADVPGYAGHFGVLKGHQSMVSVNHQGGKLTLWLDPEGNEKKEFLIHLGGTQMLHDHLSVLGRFGCEIDDIDLADVKEKAEELRNKIAERKTSLEEKDDKASQRFKAVESWVDMEETHLGWYEAQIEFVETGHESMKS